MKVSELKLLVDLYLGGNKTIYIVLAVCVSFLVLTSLPAIDNPVLLEYSVTDPATSHSASTTIYFKGNLNFQENQAETISFELNDAKLSEIQTKMGAVVLDSNSATTLDASEPIYTIRYRFWSRPIELNIGQMPAELLEIIHDLDSLVASVIEGEVSQ